MPIQPYLHTTSDFLCRVQTGDAVSPTWSLHGPDPVFICTITGVQCQRPTGGSASSPPFSLGFAHDWEAELVVQGENQHLQSQIITHISRPFLSEASKCCLNNRTNCSLGSSLSFSPSQSFKSVSVGVLSQSGAHPGPQLVGRRPGVRVRGEHLWKQGARGRAGRGRQRGRSLKLHRDAQLELCILPQSLSQRHQPAWASLAHVGAWRGNGEEDG